MWVRLGMSGNGSNLFEVEDLKDASRAVRKYIEHNDLGSGCSDDVAFAGGEVYDDGMKHVATVSYNGRVWDAKNRGKEIVL